jgi:hypothetical protein
VIAAAVAVSVGGCGGTTKLSTIQLRNQAALICAAAARQADAIPAPTTPGRSSAFLRRGVAVLRPELGHLRALRPSSDVADVYATAVGAFSQKVAVLTTTLRGIQKGDDPVVAIKTLQQRLAPLESSEDGAWRALEVPACVNR